MSKQEGPKHKRKLLPLLALTAMLILAPLGSWVYLKLGIDYRKEYIEELKPKVLDPIIGQTLHSILRDSGKVKLVHINQLNASSAIEVMNNLDERIVDKTYLKLMSLGEDQLGHQEKDKNSALTYHPEIGMIEYPSSFLLFDTSNVLRAEYKLSDDVGKELIRHLAVIIPIPAQKSEVKLKRDIQK